MEKATKKCITRGLVGIIAGTGAIIGALNITSPSRRVIVIEKQNVPRVMKVYNYDVIADQILVEDPNNVGEYIPLSKYLKRDFKNKYERNFERARIELSVSQRENKK